MQKLDYLIKNGRIVDGSGAPAFDADIAIRDGKIVAIEPRLDLPAERVLDAEGCIVTPGWVDIHTHFDGQVAWDDRLDPSFSHGVTSAIMGNCGVGFAPVRPDGVNHLIDIMEGVEDIPGGALSEGIPWGSWESYGEYLAFLRDRRFSLDVGSLIPHGALRVYAMKDRDVFAELATSPEIDAMAEMVVEGMKAGAVGFSTSRILAHKARTGAPLPGTFAAEDELMTLCSAMASTGAGVLQLVPSGALGEFAEVPDPHSSAEEVELMGRLSRATGRPVTFSLFQAGSEPRAWRDTLLRSDAENGRGADLHPQVAARSPGLLMGLSTYHLFMRRPSYLDIAGLPLDERLEQLRDPAVKRAILSETDVPHPDPGSSENFIVGYFQRCVGQFFPLRADDIDYEPAEEKSVARMAASRGREKEDLVYDLLLEDEGGAMLRLAEINYADGNGDAMYEMMMHPGTVNGLGDAGAHVSFICDASIPTTSLSHWVRDRTRGPRIPLEFMVWKMSGKNADLFGLRDRGRLCEGLRADLNIINLNEVGVGLPKMVHDLPTGAGRLVQPATGYRLTMVNGVITRENGSDTGARPGRLIEGAARAAA